MEDNKKDVKILSDEELENVAGGATYNPVKIGNHTHPTGVHSLKIKRHVLNMSILIAQILITQMLQC